MFLLAYTCMSTILNPNRNVASASPVPIYFRNTTVTANNLTAYSLLGSPGGPTNGSIVSDSTAQYYWCIGIRVFIRHSNGSETEMTSGSPVAAEELICDPDESGNVTFSGSCQWNCPKTALALTDSLVVRVYFKDDLYDWCMPVDSYGRNLTFTTYQLDALQLNSATWIANYALVATHGDRKPGVEESSFGYLAFNFGESDTDSGISGIFTSNRRNM